MSAIRFLLLFVQGLIQYLQRAGDGLDQATRERMQQRAEYLDQQMTQLIQELEQKNLEQSDSAWGDLLVWQFWALTGILLVFLILLVLWFGLKKIRCHPDNSGHEEGSRSNLVEEEEEGHNAGIEAKEGYDDAKEEVNNDENGEEVNAAANEEDEHNSGEEDNDDHNVRRNPGSLLEECIQLRGLNLDRGCSLIMDLMDKFTYIFREGLSDSFYPVPQQAIGVGSAFEGWSPRAQGLVYRVLVPLSPPLGHAFHLEPITAQMLQREFRVHVELLCTCDREQLGEDMLCFLHYPEEQMRSNQEPSLLHTLCTGSCLDVEKTVHWFCRFVRVAWLLLSQSRQWRLMLQPSSRSCIFQLSNEHESFTAEIILGVRQGDSDVFVGSHPAEVGIPSTRWLETCAVAEAKFFRHVSRRAPQDSWHCKCLQLLSNFLTGVGFSSYALKTVVMHLLNTIPLTQWRRRDFRQRLIDILKCLQCSLETKQLPHFVIGNENLPLEINLSFDLWLAEPPNLFQYLESNLRAHTDAVQEYIHLLHGLKQVLNLGH